MTSDVQRRVLVNTRNLAHRLTGVQRYTKEILARSPRGVRAIAPPKAFSAGLGGHLWEQTALPVLTHGQWLFSPANTGPLAVSRQILTVHDLSAIDHPEWVTPSFARLYSSLYPRLLPRVRAILADSAFTRDRLVARFQGLEDKIHVVHLGVDPSFRRRGPDEVEPLCARLGIRFSRYVLSLCSLEPRKNLKTLLDAWRQLLPRLEPDIGLVLSGGTGSDRVFADTNLGSLPDRTLLTGYVAEEDLPPLLSGASLFVYPSLYEGFGLPPLEAMACGTPAIVANAGSLPEVVADAALMVPPNDARELADRIAAVLNNPQLAHGLATSGEQRASYMTWDRTAERTWKTIADLTC